MNELTDSMTFGATGFDPIGQASSLVGRKITAVESIKDTDREEFAVVLDSGLVLLVSCDPGYNDELTQRTPDKWEVVLYDATDTELGKALR